MFDISRNWHFNDLTSFILKKTASFTLLNIKDKWIKYNLGQRQVPMLTLQMVEYFIGSISCCFTLFFNQFKLPEKYLIVDSTNQTIFTHLVSNQISKTCAIAQWIHLRLPSCRPGFESQANHLSFYFIYSQICAIIVIVLWKERK